LIEGRGYYLTPGLVDMHVHIQDANDLLLFAAYGVTSVRDMSGTTGFLRSMGFPDQLNLRNRIRRGELLGPTIYTAGPIMEGDPPTTPLMLVIRTPEEAASSVAWQVEQGYEYVKVYDHLSAEVYAAVLEAAREHGLPVVGHTPGEVGLEQVLAGGQVTIEHLSGYVDPDAGIFLIPEDRLQAYAEMTRQSGVWNTPTFSVYWTDRLSALPGDPCRARSMVPYLWVGRRSWLAWLRPAPASADLPGCQCSIDPWPFMVLLAPARLLLPGYLH
jgi:hypothetical protein